ncbi:MFS transporter [Calidifontibacter sp. DB0510]|uniref:MFS transporter n=1 Tax=Metallococcus carri TaxID=1656884 RepID=A0A967B4N2_9MICO|nr:MFS transporter [Metallococcus carri]NHN57205.1 MFS transporter [Metallococcus carri]NOP37992.1 MFS transporter [Calidifontibacter sp. DB2511S]
MRQRLGIPPVGRNRFFVTAMAIDAVGTGVFAPVAMLYFLATTSVGVGRVGLALSIAAAIAIPMTFVTGLLVDTFGPRPILLSANAVQALVYLGYPFVHGFTGIVVATTVASLGQALFWGSFSPTVAALSRPGEREMWFGFLGALRNVGFAVGGIASGLVVTIGTPTAFHAIVIVNAVSYAVAFAMLSRERVRRPKPTHEPTHWAIALRDKDYRPLLVNNLAYAVCSLALVYAMPVYAVSVLGLPGWTAGAIYTVNTVLVGFGQGPAVAAMRGHVRARVTAAGYVAFIVGFGLLAVASAPAEVIAVGTVLVGVAVYTVGEVMCGPVLSAIAVESRPEAERGRYLSVYQLTWNLASVIAPGGFGLLLQFNRPSVWLALIAVAAAAGLLALRLPLRLPVAGQVVTNKA